MNWDIGKCLFLEASLLSDLFKKPEVVADV